MQANGPGYQVLTGRRDGRVSNLELAAAMPDVDDSIQLLKAKFFEKGLTEKDLVVLSGMYIWQYEYYASLSDSLSLSHAVQMTLWLVKT